MKATRLRSSFASGILSRVFTSGIQFICAPLFLHFLKSEAYGIVGIFLTLSGVSNVLDFGFSQTVNREIARRLNDPEHRAEIPSVLKSFETIYWLISGVITLLLVAAAPLLVALCLHAFSISHHDLVVAMVLVGLAIGAQFPFTFYQGALTGFEKQVQANSITAYFALPRIAGTLALLDYFSPTINAFLAWQILILLAQSLTYRWFTWRACGERSGEGRFDSAHFVRVRAFLTGAGLASLLASLLMSADKVVVPAVLPLGLAGLYSLGTSPVIAVSMINSAVSSTFFPRFSRLVSAKDDGAIANLYHSSSLMASVALAAVTLTLTFFARPFLLAWTKDLDVSTTMTLPLQLMALAILFNGLMTLPYVVQLAYGWTTLGVSIAGVALVSLPPIMFALTKEFGLVGAPIAWLVGNVLMFVFQAAFMYRKILRGHALRWLAVDTILPISLMATVAWGIRFILPEVANRFLIVLELVLTLGALSAIGASYWAISQKRSMRTI